MTTEGGMEEFQGVKVQQAQANTPDQTITIQFDSVSVQIYTMCDNKYVKYTKIYGIYSR